MNNLIDPNGWQNTGTVSQSDYDKELANISQQAMVLSSLGIPIQYTDNYARTAAQEALDRSSPYYQSGLSVTQNMKPVDDGSMEAFKTELKSYGIGNTEPPIGIDARDTIKNISTWTIQRISIVVIGVIIVAIALFSLTSKDALQIVTSNPEILGA